MADLIEDFDWETTNKSFLLLDDVSLRLYWTTKNKEKIFIEDMGTKHIENIIRADMAGKLNCDEKTQDRFLLELSIRKERKIK